MLCYQDLLDIGLSPDAETLQARLVAAVATLGFGLSGGTLVRGRLASGKALRRAFGNHPEAYIATASSLDVGLRDPLLSALEARQGCYVYDQAFYADAGAGDIWDNQAPFGYRHGMAVSIHEFSHAEMFCFGVDSPDPIAADPGERFRLQGHLHMIALHAQSAARRLHTPAPSVDLNTVTKQEVESLKWAADAQSVWLTRGKVVITNLGAAQRRAAAKVGASSTPMALLRAIEGGLIDRK